MGIAALACAEAASALEWFCVRSQPKHEHVAAANLRRHYGFEVMNPRLRFKRATLRGSVWVTEPVFPGYLFARFVWSQSLRAVMHTFGVVGVVHFGSHWPTLPENIIDDLRTLLGPEEIRVIVQTVNPGDEVEVVGGSFDGFRGVVTRVMPARDRVAVLMDFFGRQTTVEVGLNALLNKKARFATQLI